MNSKAWLNFLLLGLFLLVAVNSQADDLKPFTSDGCSSFPNGTPKQNDLWLACCIVHDKAYWAGGTYEERLAADRELRACVESVGEPEIGKLMMDGVRVGGTPYLPTRFRWGFGWQYPRGYKKLTEEERRQVEKILAAEKKNQSTGSP